VRRSTSPRAPAMTTALLPADGRAFLYTSVREDSQATSTVTTSTRRRAALTATRESEYSPTPLPDGGGFRWCASKPTRRNASGPFDEDGTTRVWYRLDQTGRLPRWGDANTLVLFVLGSLPHCRSRMPVPTARGRGDGQRHRTVIAADPGARVDQLRTARLGCRCHAPRSRSMIQGSFARGQHDSIGCPGENSRRWNLCEPVHDACGVQLKERGTQRVALYES